MAPAAMKATKGSAAGSAVPVGRLRLLAGAFVLSFFGLLLVRRKLWGCTCLASVMQLLLVLQANSYLPQRDVLLLGEESKHGLRAVKNSSSCGAKVDWAAMQSDPGLNRAAVFTPYNLVVGGGERYLLSVVLAFQVGNRQTSGKQTDKTDCPYSCGNSDRGFFFFCRWPHTRRGKDTRSISWSSKATYARQ